VDQRIRHQLTRRQLDLIRDAMRQSPVDLLAHELTPGRYLGQRAAGQDECRICALVFRSNATV
jgi:hypothetical protein